MKDRMGWDESLEWMGLKLGQIKVDAGMNVRMNVMGKFQ